MIKLCTRYARDIDEAGAIYNEAMLKVFGRLHQYKGAGELQGWIRRIVVHTCIDHCRRQARFAHQPVEDVTDRAVTVEPDIYNRFSSGEVVKLLQQLPRNTALVFNLFVLEGYSHGEIAQLLGIATGTSKWHLNEARRLLKEKIDSVLIKKTYLNEI